MVDQTLVFVRGGNGGNGSRSFRREKFVADGGPDGGDGGHGGHVYLVADENMGTLLDFKRRAHYHAPNATNGQGSRKHGKTGDDLEIKVPLGTLVTDRDTGMCLADLITPGERVLVARGGRGGWGNMHFVTPENRIPRHCEPGRLGEERWLKLDLQMLAEVGIVGFPNAGKSTLLSVISRAEPKVGDYPFTTLQPVLGVVGRDTAAGSPGVVFADLPGLVEGASEGVGLGHRFLRHVERTRVLLHLLDLREVTPERPLDRYALLRTELQKYSLELSFRPEVLAVNKVDLPDSEEALQALRDACRQRGLRLLEISCHARLGLPKLVKAVLETLDSAPMPARAEVCELPERPFGEFKIEWEVDVWRVQSIEVERAVMATDMEDPDRLRHLQMQLLHWGIEDKLMELGAKPGDTVRIGKLLFDFEPTPEWMKKPSDVFRLPDDPVEVRPSQSDRLADKKVRRSIKEVADPKSRGRGRKRETRPRMW